jgi:hypothetical protein
MLTSVASLGLDEKEIWIEDKPLDQTIKIGYTMISAVFLFSLVATATRASSRPIPGSLETLFRSGRDSCFIW